MNPASAADSRPLPSAEDLPDDAATLKRLVLELLGSLHALQHDYAAVRHQVDLLLRRLYGPRGERFDPAQPLLFADLLAGPESPPPAADEPAPEASPPQRRGRPHGRRRLPENLRRVPKHHVLTEAERLCPGCGQLRADIGVDRSEQLEYHPASLFVVEHHVHKYACPCQCGAAGTQAGAPDEPAGESASMATPASEPPGPTPAPTEPAAPARAAEPVPAGPEPTDPGQPSYGVVIAAIKPAMPIAKGLPGPGLLAHLIVSKYLDHLPTYRLERIYERQGLFLPRSTLCDWLAACAELLRPLVALMRTALLQSRSLHTDDTPIKMQDPATHHLHTAQLWVYLGDAAHPYNVFDFTQTRQRDGPALFLANYQGYLHADAFGGYDGLYWPDAATGRSRIIEVACNAHARRKFHEARTSAELEAHQALAYYRQLYELERSAKDQDFSAAQRWQMRQDLAVPILEKFHRWLEAQRPDVLPKSPLGEALGYALRNWAALIRYTEAGFLDIDNNVAEREMKRVAIGRKNWLFVGSPQGGQTAAVLMSVTSTCVRLGVEPWAYLKDVLSRLPTTSAEQLADLLPDRWQATRPVEAPPASAGSPLPGETTP